MNIQQINPKYSSIMQVYVSEFEEVSKTAGIDIPNKRLIEGIANPDSINNGTEKMFIRGIGLSFDNYKTEYPELNKILIEYRNKVLKKMPQLHKYIAEKDVKNAELERILATFDNVQENWFNAFNRGIKYTKRMDIGYSAYYSQSFDANHIVLK